MISKKVILIGHFGVGKSSLVRRYVHQVFSDDYLTTIGVKIDKKEISIDGIGLKLIIWDIAGEESQQKVPQSYRLGAHGAFYIFDVSRPSTYEHLADEITYLNEIIPGIPIQVMGNKSDLLNQEELDTLKAQIGMDDVQFSSAKTGEHVEEAFLNLAKEMIK